MMADIPGGNPDRPGLAVLPRPSQDGASIAEQSLLDGRRGGLSLRIVASALLMSLIGVGVARYPLAPWTLAAPLLAYAALLWWRPAAFLIVLPFVLPVWDLGLWTGWMMVGEADFFITVTVAVLLLRSPPRGSDLLPRGLAQAVLLLFVGSWVVAAAVGLASPLDAPPSDNVFQQPANAIPMFKGLIEACVLLPFLRQRERCHGDAVVRLGWGVALGIGAATLIVLTERILFASILDVTVTYRVTGPFSSMRFGGGHIGAYFALSLPMAVCLVRLRPRWLGRGLLLLTYLMGGYGLAVTFARSAYASAAIGLAVAGTGWLWTASGRGRPTLLAATPLLMVFTILGIAAAGPGMRERFADAARDYIARENTWRAGLAARDTNALPALFGMGLGTFPRAMAVGSSTNPPSTNPPGDISIPRDGSGAYVSMLAQAPLYLGQKVPLPDSGDLHLALLARSADGAATLGVSLCDKVLLYSENCRGSDVMLDQAAWRGVAIALPTDGLGKGMSPPLLSWLRRPVELSLFAGPAGHRVDIRDVRLTDDAGHPVLVNGDFARGLDRWIMTDDDHRPWRMDNVYLMLWFETGILGVAAFLALGALALAGAIQAARRGDVTGPAVAGSMVSFLLAGLFDDVVEPARLLTLFLLIALCGLAQWETRRRTGKSASRHSGMTSGISQSLMADGHEKSYSNSATSPSHS
jgi:hypothetical protein